MYLNNNQRLQKHMEQCQLSLQDVSRLCRVSVPTVDKWLKPETSEKFRDMADKFINLLESKIDHGWIKSE